MPSQSSTTVRCVLGQRVFTAAWQSRLTCCSDHRQYIWCGEEGEGRILGFLDTRYAVHLSVVAHARARPSCLSCCLSWAASSAGVERAS